ncbi:MAG: hypothetical protein KAX49_12965 [Halanaerobiales bacterium]|nr:hypothetical protein [Halanaerobiales bacterium]
MDKDKVQQELNQLVYNYGNMSLLKEELEQKLINLKMNLEHMKSQIVQSNKLLTEEEQKTD